MIDKCTSASQFATGTAYGIYFGNLVGGAVGPTNCVVKNCQLYNNIGTSGSFGFKDFIAASSTSLLSNLAYGQGGISPSLGNLVSGLAHANYMIQYNQTSDVRNSNDIFEEGSLTSIGAITTTGLGTTYVNVSIS